MASERKASSGIGRQGDRVFKAAGPAIKAIAPGFD
jgi:hypothetical protein